MTGPVRVVRVEALEALTNTLETQSALIVTQQATAKAQNELLQSLIAGGPATGGGVAAAPSLPRYTGGTPGRVVWLAPGNVWTDANPRVHQGELRGTLGYLHTDDVVYPLTGARTPAPAGLPAHADLMLVEGSGAASNIGELPESLPANRDASVNWTLLLLGRSGDAGEMFPRAGIPLFVPRVGPTVALSVTPESRTTEGPVTLSATASDADGTVASVQFYRGNTPLGPAQSGKPGSATYTQTDNVTRVLNGTINYRVVVKDNDGNATEKARGVTVNIAAPAPGYALNLAAMPRGVQAPQSALERLFDITDGNGGSNRGMRVDTDADVPEGVPPSPVTAVVDGQLRGVLLREFTYGGTHVVAIPGSPASAGGDFLLLFATVASTNFPGVAWGVSGETWFASRFKYDGLLSLQQLQAQGTVERAGASRNGGSLTATSLLPDLTLPDAVRGHRKLTFMRVNVNGATVRTRVWNYDAARPLAEQGVSEPSEWTQSYTHTAPFGLGRMGYTLGQGSPVFYLASQSNDPAVPAAFVVKA